jgi:alpha-pyrone synthase
MSRAYINRIATAVPEHEIHGAFVRFAEKLLRDRRSRLIFERMVARSEIKRRWSCLAPAKPGSNQSVDIEGFYTLGKFATTAQRMARYQIEAPALATRAVDRLVLGDTRKEITHLIITSCTGFSAPGIDVEMVQRCGLNPSVERTLVGFMGCNAAINALKLAHHFVRSAPTAKVLVISVELCTLHLRETENIEQLLAFLLFGDGCSAALITGQPLGFALERFHTELAPRATNQITWNIGDFGFDVVLSGQIPSTIANALRSGSDRVFSGASSNDIDVWAVHPGGRTVLDAVEDAFHLDQTALAPSRAILRDYGNMSSPTVMFVLEALMRKPMPAGARGCAMAFGPGLAAETMLFSAAA